MTPRDLEVRRLVYDGVITRGVIPLIAELAESAALPVEQITQSLGSLADAHMLVLQPENGEVLMANPFSAVPTPFVVRARSRSWYANCIWDSMGVAAMLHSDVRLEASCGCCGSAVELDIPEGCRDEDPRIAHFAIPAARWWDDIVFN